MIDRIIEVEEGKRAVGIKNVTTNEEFFNGHFPDYPVMPGVLIVEALAQVSAVIMLIKEENRGKIGLFAGIDNCRFKKQVRPGDQLRLEVEMTRVRGLIAKAHAIATIDDEIVCEADVTFALFDNKKA
ncbi:3-hydroxyacyl-ACP dehydratase FabZ [Bacillus cereus]|uniref:3-hydroxyacyl-ACP dehydratase FabZ n=1 Tax=Bacillus cereus TaxID=1396 RepID=UPI002ADEAD5D|nr:3-hydroxyacyl-ACP dehydratase FabZ [Bacillus cereus]MEA1012931.1 3-hydroxyacyl-ACP dehydratase FabZ [Bacillus cereus]